MAQDSSSVEGDYVNTRDFVGLTPLLLLTALQVSQREELIKYLRRDVKTTGNVSVGSDMSIVPETLDPHANEDKSIEDEAILELATLLLDAGADVNSANAAGWR